MKIRMYDECCNMIQFKPVWRVIPFGYRINDIGCFTESSNIPMFVGTPGITPPIVDSVSLDCDSPFNYLQCEVCNGEFNGKLAPIYRTGKFTFITLPQYGWLIVSGNVEFGYFNIMRVIDGIVYMNDEFLDASRIQPLMLIEPPKYHSGNIVKHTIIKGLHCVVVVDEYGAEYVYKYSMNAKSRE